MSNLFDKEIERAEILADPNACQRCCGTGYDPEHDEPDYVGGGFVPSTCIACGGTGVPRAPDEVLPPSSKDGFP